MSKMEELLKQVNKEANEEIMSIGLNEFKYNRIPFTSPRMNYCSFGGLPIGKLIEFYGEEHGGKTTTALDIVANYQNMEDAKKVLYVDAENTLDVEWARKIGVNVDDMYIMQPKSQSAEEIFKIVEDSVDTGEIGLWVIDSLGMLLSQQAWEKDITEKTYAGISMALTNFTKRIEMINAKHRCTGIGINQIRDVIGSMFPMTTTPGGKAWKHGCAVRMEFRKGDYIDDKGNKLNRSAESPAGNIVMMSMTKNKTCPPTRRTGFYTLNYEIGIDYLKDLVDVAIKYGIIEKSGSWFKILDDNGEVLEDKIQGQAKVYEVLEDNQELLGKIEHIIDSKMLV